MRSNRVKKLSKLISLTLSVLLITLIFASCAKKEESVVSPDWYSERHSTSHPVDSFPKTDDKDHSSVSSYLIPLAKEDLIKQSTLVVIGKIMGFDYLTIKPADDRSPLVHTDYYVDVIETLRGEAKTDDNGLIIVRTQGGENDDVIEVCGDLRLNVGDTYLLFLMRPTTGGGYTTEGTFYLPLNISIGVFSASKNTIKNDSGNEVPESFTPFEATSLLNEDIYYTELSKDIKTINEQFPADEETYIRQYKENLLANLNSGFITQKEYDDAIADLSNFATILYYTE